MTPEQELRRAHDARQVLDAPIFQEACRNLEEQLRIARRAVPISASDMHTRIILMEQLYGNFLAYFEQLAQTGKLVEIQMEERRQRQSLMERGLAMFRTGGRNGI